MILWARARAVRARTARTPVERARVARARVGRARATRARAAPASARASSSRLEGHRRRAHRRCWAQGFRVRVCRVNERHPSTSMYWLSELSWRLVTPFLFLLQSRRRYPIHLFRKALCRTPFSLLKECSAIEVELGADGGTTGFCGLVTCR